MPTQLFETGMLVATPGALQAYEVNGQQPLEHILKHTGGDWGVLSDEDKQANDRAVEHGGRIFSAYLLHDGTKIWVITEADRSSTCTLCPSEY